MREGGLTFIHAVSLGEVLHADGYCDPLINCVSCHGADLKGGSGQSSCYTCHGARWQICSTPHLQNFGGVFHAEGSCEPLNYCVACHGVELRGGSSGQPSCYSCHGAAWETCGARHTISLGGHLHAEGYCDPQNNCVVCHGVDLRGGSSGQPSCYTCHGVRWETCGTPHDNNLGGVGHADDYCLPYQNCSGCHGTNLRGGSSGQPSCLSCHNQRQWMDCGSIQHNDNEDGHLHARDKKRPMDLCNRCHGADLRGGYNREPSCYTCHGAEWEDDD